MLKEKKLWANKWMKEAEETNGVVCVIGGGASVSALGTKERGGRKVTYASVSQPL